MAEEAGGSSSRADFELLKVAVMNEKGAPELLQYEGDLVDRLSLRLQQSEETAAELDRLKASLVDGDDEVPRPLVDLEHIVVMEDMGRLRFLLKEYLRTRLAKIERFYMHILETEQEISKLSAAELEFAKEYTVVMLRHMNDNVLTFFPGPYQDHFTQRKDGTEAPAKRDMVSRPDLDRYTFVKALEDVDVDAGEEAGKVEMKKGNLVVMRYHPEGRTPGLSSARELLQAGIVKLV